MQLPKIIVYLIFLTLVSTNITPNCKNEKELKKFLSEEYEKIMSDKENKRMQAYWEATTDINNQTKLNNLYSKIAEMMDYKSKIWSDCFKKLNPKSFKDPVLKRQIELLRVLDDGFNSLYPKFKEAKICPLSNRCCDLDTEGLDYLQVRFIMETSRNYCELEHTWNAWREATNFRNEFKETVHVFNTVANINGFNDIGEMWRNDFESKNFKKELHVLWQKLKLLYEHLHIYVLYKLSEEYPEHISIYDKYIPAHLVDAVSWEHLYDLVKPFPDINISEEFVKEEYTVEKLFELADAYYQSFNLPSTAFSYDSTSGSILKLPPDRQMSCLTDSVDFANGKDYKIKMCGEVNLEYYEQAHHELSYIQYFTHYKNQSIAFRKPPAALGEGVAGSMTLAALSPQRLHKLGFLKKHTYENEINFLMKTALKFLPKLASSYVLERWRWGVFSGDILEENWNKKWWCFKEKIQKIKAPERRKPSDLDPLANFYVSAFAPHIKNFVSAIVQFQILQAFCRTAGELDTINGTGIPLYYCDLYGSKHAGVQLNIGMSLGRSLPWKDVFNIFTREDNMSVDALISYFEPLQGFLYDEMLKISKKKISGYFKYAFMSIFSFLVFIFVIYISIYVIVVKLGDKKKHNPEI